MMNQKNVLILTLIFLILSLFVITLLLVSGCVSESPPDAMSAQQLLRDNEDSIRTVVEYLIDTGFENVHISGASKSMLADLSDCTIDNPTVYTAVNELIDEGSYIDIKKRGNTIVFEQWNGLRDIGCGIAYSINETDFPEILFLVELTPISPDGWFYYLYDYNTWRNHRTD